MMVIVLMVIVYGDLDGALVDGCDGEPLDAREGGNDGEEVGAALGCFEVHQKDLVMENCRFFCMTISRWL